MHRLGLKIAEAGDASFTISESAEDSAQLPPQQNELYRTLGREN